MLAEKWKGNEVTYSIHDNNLHAVKARILVDAVVELVRAGVKQSFYIRKMLWGIRKIGRRQHERT